MLRLKQRKQLRKFLKGKSFYSIKIVHVNECKFHCYSLLLGFQPPAYKIKDDHLLSVHLSGFILYNVHMSQVPSHVDL